MRKFLSIAALGAILFVSNAEASVMLQTSCFFDGGGYDDEYITLKINPGGQTLGFKYDSYRGELPGFTKVSERVYAHSLEEEIIYTMVSFDKNYKKASMIVNYKTDGSELFRQTFKCKFLD